jgi:hypothetical protein
MGGHSSDRSLESPGKANTTVNTPATDRYWQIRDDVFVHGRRNAVPHDVLRAYLDEQATIKKFRPGLFNFRVTMSKAPLQVRVSGSDE